MKVNKNYLLACLLSFSLGFNSFSINNSDVYYYKSIMIKKYAYNGKIYMKDFELLDYMKDAFKYEKKGSFNHMINHFLSFTEKSIMFKFFKMTGISSMVIGMSDIKNHLNDDFIFIFKVIGLVYIIYNFMVLLLSTVALFSKLFSLINKDFPFFMVLESNKEKMFYVLGMLTQFILDVMLMLVSTMLQCYIVDMYFYNVLEMKVFNLDTIFYKFLKKNTFWDIFKNYFCNTFFYGMMGYCLSCCLSWW